MRCLLALILAAAAVEGRGFNLENMVQHLRVFQARGAIAKWAEVCKEPVSLPFHLTKLTGPSLDEKVIAASVGLDGAWALRVVRQ